MENTNIQYTSPQTPIYSPCLFNDFFQVKLLNRICEARNMSHFAVILRGNKKLPSSTYSSLLLIRATKQIILAKGTVIKRRAREVGGSFLTPIRGDAASLVLRLINQFSVYNLIVMIMIFLPKQVENISEFNVALIRITFKSGLEK